MSQKPHLTIVVMLLVALVAGVLQADTTHTKSNRPIDERTVEGTYVFAGRVVLNPIVDPTVNANPPRVLIDCFSIGEIRFDGRGKIKRRVEIRCPATPNLLSVGLGAPAPVGKPTAQEISVMGSTMTSEGTYELNADGWGGFSDSGAFRLGPLPGNPTSGAGRISVSGIKDGVAQELVLLLDHQSLQPPGAPALVNSDIGAAFVAQRR